MTAPLNRYLVLPSSLIEMGSLALRAVAPEDIDFIRQWRNAQMPVLRQSSPISLEEQQRYFAKHVWPFMESLRPPQLLLAIERQGELIGYGGLVHINWEASRAEVSFLLKPEYESQEDTLSQIFREYLDAIYELAFVSLGLHRLTTETFEFRKVHLKVMEESGLKLEGILRSHVRVGGELMSSYLHGILASEWSKGSVTIKQPGILVTSASRKIPLIRSVKDASRRLGSKPRVIGGDRNSQSIAQFEVDEFWVMPELNLVSIDKMISECQRRDIKVILPTRDGELDYWAYHRDTFSDSGIEVIVSLPQSISRCRDKLDFAQFGERRGLPIISASMTPEGITNSLFVVKERYGAGSRGIGLGLSKDAALEHAKGLREPIFQPFIDGPEISIDSWVSKTGCVPGVVLRRRDVIFAGESQVTTTFQDVEIEREAIKAIKALELRGPVVLQAIISEYGLQIIECNPRFGGASTASIAAGLDSLYWSLAEVEDIDFKPIFRRTSFEVRQVRYPADRIIYDSCF